MTFIKNYINALKYFITYMGGMGLYYFYLATYTPYYGAQRVYKILQGPEASFQRKCLYSFLMGHYGRLKNDLRRDYDFYLRNKDQMRLSDLAIAQYSDDGLKGYGDAEFKKGGDTLDQQQRGQILPFLRDYLRGKDGLSIYEIGTANGDVLAHLAESFPDSRYIGIDLSVANAEAKHTAHKNLSFKKGYALNMLEANQLNGGDAVFFSSTLVVFNPNELAAYFTELKKNGVKNIFINEPFWAGYECNDNQPAYSKHMELATWFHNYPAYLKAAGYKVERLEMIKNYKHPRSQREDITVFLCHAKLAA